MGEMQFGPVDFSHFLESVGAAKDAARHLLSGMTEARNIEAVEAMLEILEANEAEFHAVVPEIMRAEMEQARENELELARLQARSKELDEELNRALAEAKEASENQADQKQEATPPLRPGLLVGEGKAPDFDPAEDLVSELMEAGKQTATSGQPSGPRTSGLIWEDFLPISKKRKQI